MRPGPPHEPNSITASEFKSAPFEVNLFCLNLYINFFIKQTQRCVSCFKQPSMSMSDSDIPVCFPTVKMQHMSRTFVENSKLKIISFKHYMISD